MLLWMKSVWIPNSNSDVLFKFPAVGVFKECRRGWGKTFSVNDFWYDSLLWDVFFFITNFCTTSWVTNVWWCFYRCLLRLLGLWNFESRRYLQVFSSLLFFYDHEYFWFESFKTIIIVCFLNVLGVITLIFHLYSDWRIGIVWC